MVDDTLRPCPRCGSTRVSVDCSWSTWYVECANCGEQGPDVEDGVEDDSNLARSLWNTYCQEQVDGR